jgi:diadenosine tetraphosphatase ApaH/serine/threonine PP2A family protein phosphatase
VGQPRDNDARACYGILDHEKREFSYRRIPYDIDTYQRKMERAGMPSFLVTRVAEGI